MIRVKEIEKLISLNL